MYTSPLLQTPPPNVHRITSTGRFGSNFEFSKEFPPMLRGIMTEPEYVEYIRRLEEAGKAPKLPIPLLAVAPFLLTGISWISVLWLDFQVVWVISLGCFALSMAAVYIGVGSYTSRNSKAALARIEVVINEINQRYYSRGVKWTHIPKAENASCYIDVVLFNPNSTAPTDPWTGMSYSTTATAPPLATTATATTTATTTAPGYAATAAPPPTSYSTTGTILSYPGYPSAPPPTATAPQPAYPGGPSKPYAY